MTPATSSTPPTTAGATNSSVAGSVSPIREQSRTPDTEVSISPMRRHSNTPSLASVRGVSPGAVRKALGPLDRLRNSSPVANKSGHTPQNPTPLQQSQQAEQIKSPAENDLSASKRLSLNTKLETIPASPPVHQPTTFTSHPSSLLPAQQPSKAAPPSKADDDDEVEVISMSPAQATPIQSWRRSRGSLILSGNGSSSNLVSVPENGSPATYVPTTGDTSLHDGKKYRSASVGAEKPYFGQRLSQFDLIANNIENAFVSMR